MNIPGRYRDDGNEPEAFREDDDRFEETYPDGNVKHECWNSGKLKRIRNTEDDEEWNWKR